MGLTDGAAYADVKRINEELEYAKGIMRRLHCTIINVSNRAIEETAGMILEYVQKNKDRPLNKNNPRLSEGYLNCKTNLQKLFHGHCK